MSFLKYGHEWKLDDALAIEMTCIQQGGTWMEGDRQCGEGLFHHYREMWKLLWPDQDLNRWTDLILKSYCENDITVTMGCKNANKTHTISKIALSDYWCFPNDTLWMISTTEGRGADLRVWGVVCELFNAARKKASWLAGNPIDYKKTITTGVIDKDRLEARSLRKGLIILPCGDTKANGLGRMIGIKAPRLRHAGDEVPQMSENFLDAYTNWHGGDFKGLMTGNFCETDDPLGIAAEPEGGWDTFEDTGKTQEWKSKFFDAHVIALDGRDSPNFDYPDHETNVHYPYLMTHKMLNAIEKTHGTDSWEWHSQGVGKPVKGMDIWRVLNRDFCIKHKAMEDVSWDSKRTGILALDPAYGLGDLCVLRHMEFGRNTEGKWILLTHEPRIIPIKIGMEIEQEDQIALYVKTVATQLGIPPSNIFYDSFGRGTLGFSFAKVFGLNCPVPVDSSAQPTKRPVRFDLYVETPNHQKRLKRCDEHYKKFITELWFSVRQAIQCEQIRGLDMETIREGSSRKFTNENNYIVLETKEDMKKRTNGRSPDRFDCLSVGLEGARRLGFRIERLGTDVVVENNRSQQWLLKAVEQRKQIEKSHELVEV